MSSVAAMRVLRVFQEEVRLVARYGLKYDLSQCIVYLLVGEGFRGDIAGFQALSVHVVLGADIQILKAPICGSPEFPQSFCATKQADWDRTFQAISSFPKKHMAFHLLQKGMGFCQLNYLARTTPRPLLASLFHWYVQ